MMLSSNIEQNSYQGFFEIFLEVVQMSSVYRYLYDHWAIRSLLKHSSLEEKEKIMESLQTYLDRQP